MRKLILIFGILIIIAAGFVFNFDSQVYQQVYQACQNGVESACETLRTEYWFVQFLPK